MPVIADPMQQQQEQQHALQTFSMFISCITGLQISSAGEIMYAPILRYALFNFSMREDVQVIMYSLFK